MTQHLDLIKSLGADRPIAYTAEGFMPGIKPDRGCGPVTVQNRENLRRYWLTRSKKTVFEQVIF